MSMPKNLANDSNQYYEDEYNESDSQERAEYKGRKKGKGSAQKVYDFFEYCPGPKPIQNYNLKNEVGM